MRKWRNAALMLFMMLLCQGCLSTGELLSAPRPGVLAQQLQAQIDELLLASNYRSSAPTAGDNRQFLQMRDLDGDGNEEALLFLRSNTSEAIEHSIMLFTQQDDEYILGGSIVVVATAIQSVSYADLDGDGLQEILVGWGTDSITALSVYALRDGKLEEISEPLTFNNYALTNLRGADTAGLSIILIRTDSNALRGTAEMYDMKDGVVTLTAQTSLSQDVIKTKRMRVGLLNDGVNGVYVTSHYVPPQFQHSPTTSNAEITDILCFRDDTLVNVSLNMELGYSDLLVRPAQVAASDIDKDSILDLATMELLPAFPLPADSEEEPDAIYEYLWHSYDSTGMPEYAARSYHSQRDPKSWYILLGAEWPQRYTVRLHNIGTTTFSTTFFYWPSDEADPVAMLTITSIVRNAGDFSEIKGRIILNEATSHVILGELHDLPESLVQYRLTQDKLKSMFYLVEPDWR